MSHYAHFEELGLPDSEASLAPPSEDFIERLECRLALLNEQIIKLSALAAKATDEEVQEKYWIAAQEASRQAREVREYLTKLSNTPSAQ